MSEHPMGADAAGPVPKGKDHPAQADPRLFGPFVVGIRVVAVQVRSSRLRVGGDEAAPGTFEQYKGLVGYIIRNAKQKTSRGMAAAVAGDRTSSFATVCWQSDCLAPTWNEFQVFVRGPIGFGCREVDRRDPGNCISTAIEGKLMRIEKNYRPNLALGAWV